MSYTIKIKQILVLATNTFRIVLREKTLYFITLFLLIPGAFSFILKPLVIGEIYKVIHDFAASTMLLLGILISIVIGTLIIQIEYKQKTIYLILSKPVSRETFILGKYFGLCMSTLFVEVLAAFVFASIMFLLSIPIGWNFILVFVFIQLQIFIVSAINIFFSSFSTPITSAVFTFLTTLSGIFISSALSIGNLFEKLPPFTLKVLQVTSFILPSLSDIDIKSLSYSNLPLKADFVLFGFSYTIAYIILSLSFAILIFNKKEFN